MFTILEISEQKSILKIFGKERKRWDVGALGWGLKDRMEMERGKKQ